MYLHFPDTGSIDTWFHPLTMCVGFLYTLNSDISLSYLGCSFPIHLRYIWILSFLMKFEICVDLHLSSLLLEVLEFKQR